MLVNTILNYLIILILILQLIDSRITADVIDDLPNEYGDYNNEGVIEDYIEVYVH